MVEKLKTKTQELTKAELEIMQILWTIERGFVNDVLAELWRIALLVRVMNTILWSIVIAIHKALWLASWITSSEARRHRWYLFSLPTVLSRWRRLQKS